MGRCLISISMYNSCTILEQSIVGCILFGSVTCAEQFFRFVQTLLCRVLLQDNQIASHFCTCIICEKIIR